MTIIKFERQPITTGDQDKPIVFFEEGVNAGPEVGSDETAIHFRCMAEVYESSMKDVEAHSTVSAKNLITVKIRDTYGDYLPKTHHKFRIEHYNYPGDYNVINVSPDTRDKGFMKIVGEWHG